MTPRSPLMRAIDDVREAAAAYQAEPTAETLRRLRVAGDAMIAVMRGLDP
jgi:NaMN:DMB phosphoribosyltransferase